MKEAFTKIKEAIANIHRVVKTDEDLEWNRAIYKCSTIVSEVEAEYGNGWIPCSERLPEEPKENPFLEGKPLELYLVSMKHDKYPWRAFWNGKDFTDGWSIVQPEAWMPLPEAYKPEKGE